jgi:hypothetical protein
MHPQKRKKEEREREKDSKATESEKVIFLPNAHHTDFPPQKGERFFLRKNKRRQRWLCRT